MRALPASLDRMFDTLQAGGGLGWAVAEVAFDAAVDHCPSHDGMSREEMWALIYRFLDEVPLILLGLSPVV